MGINMKKLGITTSKYVALLVLTLTNMPIAYATDIKASIEQGKAEAYYKETVNDQKESVIPDASNLESKKQDKASVGKTTIEQVQEEPAIGHSQQPAPVRPHVSGDEIAGQRTQ